MFYIIKGGPVMIPIILGSVLGLAIVLERFLVMRRAQRLDMEAFSKNIYKNISEEKFEDALKSCRQNADYPLPSMFAAAIENRRLSRHHLEKVLERMGNHYVHVLEKRLGGLVSIVGIEPLLGFLGTITGLIRAFMSWEKAGSEVTVSALAQGIYQAMITTAAGLIVAIPLYLFYNYFISKVKYFAHELDDYSSRLLEALAQERVK